MFCRKCGQELDYNNLCTNPSCPSKNNLTDANNINNNSYSAQEFNYYDEITTEDLTTFIGNENTEYYLNQWDKYQHNTSFISWNWPGFFFSWLWFAYRKMYAHAAIIYFGPYVLYFLAILLPIKVTVFVIPLIMLGIRIAVPLLSNQLYTKYIEKTITSIKTAIHGRSDEDINRRLHERGGINWIPVIIVSIISVIYLILIITFISSGIALMNE